MNPDTKKKSLTKAELHLMNILWDKGEATVRDLVGVLPEPKPAYTTVLTVMQVLTKKKIVEPYRQGKVNVFKPLMSRDQYISGFMEETRNTLFKGSMRNFLLFFARNEKIDKAELREILKEMAETDGGTE
ncbi:MAG TPA: BlaI/MecI/CopY family transcriptional regulator [Alloprevotella sp.]|nr:BlaI/MecI/CopY family transcriptional regulator [Alloprevotella sp.]